MNLYSLPNLITAFLVSFLGALVLFKNKNSLINQAFFLLTVATASWLIFAFVAYNSSLENKADLFMRLSCIGVTFIPITLLSFTLEFLKIRTLIKYKPILYIVGFIIGITILFSNILIKGVDKYFWGYYPLAGWAHPFYLVGFVSLVTASITFLILEYLKKDTQQLKKHQIRYVVIGIFVFNFASFDFLPNYGIEVYAFGFIPATLFLIIICYSIVRYRLMDIKLAITQTSIFILVYSIVLGAPIAMVFWGRANFAALLGDNWFWVPMISLLILATIGPFIYSSIQKRAYDQLTLEETKRSEIFKKAILGLRNIRSLEKYIQTLITIITRQFGIKYSSIYLLDNELSRYVQKYSNIENNYIKILESGSPLVNYLNNTNHKVIITEEFELHSTEENKIEILNDLKSISSHLLVPIIHENVLTGFLVMDNLSSGKPFSKIDLDVLSVVGSGAGADIDACYAWETTMKILDELGVRERMSSLDMMAGSIAHEIHNPIHAISQEVGYIEDSVKDLQKYQDIPSDILEGLGEAGSNIGVLAERVKNMVNTILQFAKKGNTELEKVLVDDVVNDFEILMKPHFKHDHLRFTKDIEQKLPPIYVNRVLLVTALMNFAKNSLHAIRNRDEKKIHLKIYRLNSKIKIEFSDNGYGIEEKKLQVIFAAFQTTKGTSDGTGLGLYRARRDIVDHFKGKLWATSEGRDKGATIHCELPIYDVSKKGDLNE